MKILGIGVDIIQNKRLKNLIFSKTFLSRTFSKNEIKISKKFQVKQIIFQKDLLQKKLLLNQLELVLEII